MSADTEKAKTVKLRYEKEWLRIDGVTAVGLGLIDRTVGIVISVENNVDQVRAQIPDLIDGIPTLVRQTGMFNI